MGTELVAFKDFATVLNKQKSLPRYVTATEPKPAHAWFELDKSAIDGLLKDLAQYIADLLKDSPKTDKELQHLLRTSSELAHVTRSPPLKVALLGAQGAGKSLLINAIFDCDGLSLTGADGAACTSSVTRYAAYPESQPSGNNKMFAEIKFLDPAARGKLLREHAKAYYQYMHIEEDLDNEDSTGPAIARIEEVDQRLKDTAEDIFVTLFGSHEAFINSWSAQAYKNEQFLSLAQLKCEEAVRRENLDDRGIAMKIANNQRDLLKQLRPFLTKVKGVTCLWPLVDGITIRLCHDIVQAGIELIDLPGKPCVSTMQRFWLTKSQAGGM